MQRGINVEYIKSDVRISTIIAWIRSLYTVARRGQVSWRAKLSRYAVGKRERGLCMWYTK